MRIPNLRTAVRALILGVGTVSATATDPYNWQFTGAQRLTNGELR